MRLDANTTYRIWFHSYLIFSTRPRAPTGRGASVRYAAVHAILLHRVGQNKKVVDHEMLLLVPSINSSTHTPAATLLLVRHEPLQLISCPLVTSIRHHRRPQRLNRLVLHRHVRLNVSHCSFMKLDRFAARLFHSRQQTAAWRTSRPSSARVTPSR
jgi:hypothetical protein